MDFNFFQKVLLCQVCHRLVGRDLPHVHKHSHFPFHCLDYVHNFTHWATEMLLRGMWSWRKKKHIGLEIQKVHAVASETANNFSKRSILCVLQSFDLGPLITTQVKFILVICVLPLKAVFLNLWTLDLDQIIFLLSGAALWIAGYCDNQKCPQTLLNIPGEYIVELRWWCCLVSQSCLTLRDSMNCSTPGFPVPHHLPEFAQVHVPCIGDAIQSSHPLTPSSSAFNLSQHQGLFQWVSHLHQVTKILELQLQHQSFQLVFRVLVV